MSEIKTAHDIAYRDLERKCKTLESENAELRDVIGDYRNDASRVLDEKCPSDERHCGCVPILRDQLNKYQKALILITTMPELSQATTIAREALQERGKFIWTEQSVGEYWVTKLDILQDKFDTLEKDYADVCHKRLEAADVFSRQIIELESRIAELEEENDRLQDGWFRDETICPDGSLRPKVSDLLNRIAELEAENERLSQLLHDEMSQLEIATDLGNKRWTALNKIYEDGEKHNANWCKRMAQEGLGIK